MLNMAEMYDQVEAMFYEIIQYNDDINIATLATNNNIPSPSSSSSKSSSTGMKTIQTAGAKRQQNNAHNFHPPRPSSTRNPIISYHLLKPSLFTIAELIRTARHSHNANLAYDVMIWGLDAGDLIYFPMELIRAAISFLYR